MHRVMPVTVPHARSIFTFLGCVGSKELLFDAIGSAQVTELL